jgi:hypothetical protein
MVDIQPKKVKKPEMKDYEEVLSYRVFLSEQLPLALCGAHRMSAYSGTYQDVL